MEEAKGVKMRIVGGENSAITPTSLDGSFTSYQNTINDKSSAVGGKAGSVISP